MKPSSPAFPFPAPGRPEGAPPAPTELLAQRFRAMGEPMRLRLLMTLRTRELTVTELAERQETSPANASKHLHVLVAAGLLQRRRKGLHVLYGIADPAVFPLCDSVCHALRRALEERARPFGR